jgi:hypothetical protein
LELLSTDPDFAIRLGANASMIYRALALTWPQSTKQMRAVFGPVLDVIVKTTNPLALQSLTQAAAALAPRLSPEQAQAALGPVIDAIAKTTNPFALQSLARRQRRWPRGCRRSRRRRRSAAWDRPWVGPPAAKKRRNGSRH